MSGPMTRMTGNVNKFTSAGRSSVGGMMSAMNMGNMAMLGGAGLFAYAVKDIVNEASKMENAIAMFTPILGGVENATKMVETLNDVASRTPYQFEQLTGPTNMLIGLGGVLQNDVAKSLEMIGDLAGGSAEHMQGIATVYSQVRSAGKMNLGDLMQFTNNGVPLLAQLAKQWGVTNARAREMIKDKGTFEEVEKALRSMTSEGGKFYHAMIIQSETFSGVNSTLRDNISMTEAEIGLQLLPTLKELSLSFIDLTGSIRQFVRDHKEGIGTVIKLLFKVLSIVPYIVGLYVAWKIATWGVIIAQRTMTALGWLSYIWMMRDAIGAAVMRTQAWAVAQRIINFVLAANPIGIIIVAVGALAYAIYDLYTNWESYALQFNISIQNFITGFARAKMEVYELLNAIGLISDKELTGAKLSYLENFTAGVKMRTQQLQQNNAPITQRDSMNQIIESKSSEQNLNIRNDSKNNVDLNGRNIPQGRRLKLQPSGG